MNKTAALEGLQHSIEIGIAGNSAEKGNDIVSVMAKAIAKNYDITITNPLDEGYLSVSSFFPKRLL